MSRAVKIGETEVGIRASAPALLYYHQEFGADLLQSLTSMFDKGMSGIGLLQLVWAMAKADAPGKPFPSFEKWVSTLDAVDFSDPELIGAVTDEATSGFFRSADKAE
jgi:hypothetical protein